MWLLWFSTPVSSWFPLQVWIFIIFLQVVGLSTFGDETFLQNIQKRWFYMANHAKIGLVGWVIRKQLIFHSLESSFQFLTWEDINTINRTPLRECSVSRFEIYLGHLIPQIENCSKCRSVWGKLFFRYRCLNFISKITEF